MILLTVGTQLPFDRLTTVIDGWAGSNPAIEVVGQIGPTQLVPRNFKADAFMRPADMNRHFGNARLIVSHAGMGSILTALRFRKPIVIFPRVAAKGEHRNEHQLATAKWLEGTPGLTVAWSEVDLLRILDGWDSLAGGEGISEFAPPAFTDRLRASILGHEEAPR